MPIPDAQDPIINLPSPPAKKASDYLGSYDSWVYTAVGAIAQEVAALTLRLFKKVINKGNKETKEIDEHEALSLLYHVNEFYTMYDLLEGTAVYCELVGEAFWAKLRAGNRPAELWLMRPDWVKVIKDPKEYIRGYQYYPGGIQGGSRGVFFERKDVVPFKYFNPLNPYRGYGPVQAAAMEIDTDKFSAEYNRTFFFNNAQAGTILSTDAKLSEPVIKRFVTSWRKNFMGRQNAHKVAVLTGGQWKVDQTTQTMKDMSFDKQREMMRNNILATFKVPRTVIGITDDVSVSNAEATTRAFIERVIVPRARKLVMTLNEYYLREWDDKGNLFFDFDDPTPEDVETKLKVYKNALGGDGGVPWMTINEVRDRENLEPLDGGDDLYIPFSMQSSTGSTPPAPGQEGKAIVLKGKKQKKSGRKFMMPIPPAKLQEIRARNVSKKIKHDLAKLVGVVMAQKEAWEDKAEEFWKRMIVKTDVFENIMVEKIWRLFAQQEEYIKNGVDSIKSVKKSVRKSRPVDDFLFDLDDEARMWIKEFGPFLQGVMKDKGKEILEWLGINAELDLATQSAADYIKTEGLNFAKNVNETTLEQLRVAIGKGLANEESIPEIRQRITEVFDQARGVRGLMIARTEVLRSTNFATTEAYRQSGVVEKKIWYTAMDERVCPQCGPLHGMETDVNGKFNTPDFGRVDSPPAHVNCRCTVIAGILK